MPIKIYMDHNVPRAITDGLRSRGVDVITSFEDHSQEFDDSDLLDRASELGCVLFTMDYNLLQEATKWQREGKQFMGVIYAHQLRVSIGVCIQNLELIAKVGNPDDMVDRVEFLP